MDEQNNKQDGNKTAKALDTAASIAKKTPAAPLAHGYNALNKLSGGKLGNAAGNVLNKVGGGLGGTGFPKAMSGLNRNKNANGGLGESSSFGGEETESEEGTEQKEEGAGTQSGDSSGKSGEKSSGISKASNAMNAAKKLLGGGGKSGGGKGGVNPASAASASADIAAKAKKFAKVMKVIGPIMPFVFQLGVVFLIIIIITSQILVIKDQVGQFITNTFVTFERLNNFISGNGWNTSEENFFRTLTLAYSDFQGSENRSLDIPLIAATIHYTIAVDSTTFDGDNYEKNELVSEEEVTENDTSIFGGAIDAYKTRSFYEVANYKLGNYGFVFPGKMGLLGHLIHTRISFSWTSDIRVFISEWKNFFTTFIADYIDLNFKSIDEYKQADDGSTFAAVVDEAADIVSGVMYLFYPTRILKLLINAGDLLTDVRSFREQNQSLLSWSWRNLLYELEEFLTWITGSDDDSYLMNSKLSYYSTLDGESIGGGAQVDGSLEGVDLSKEYTDDDAFSFGKLPYPVWSISMDYKRYYRYLVNIYLPETYHFREKKDVDYTMDDLIREANEIFDQKYHYMYLTDGLNRPNSTCIYNFEEKSDLSVDTSFLSNLKVNVLDYGVTDTSSGRIAETVSLEDYVVGVLYREVGASINDNKDYLIANIIAIKSFTIGRREITQDGSDYYITMKNSTDDQVYCSLTKGCLDAASNKKPAPSAELVAYLKSLYQESYNYFLYNSTSSKFTGYYRANNCPMNITGECMSQNGSQQLGIDGNDWKTILATYYKEPVGLIDISSSKFSVSGVKCYSSGLALGDAGFIWRSGKPNPSNPDDKYFDYVGRGGSYPVDSAGQCVWYMYGRVNEIIGNSTASEEKKEEARAAMLAAWRDGTTNNGSGWCKKNLCETFYCEYDSSKPKPGAIGVYEWSAANYERKKKEVGASSNYGHVIVIERVDGDQVTYSESGNKMGLIDSKYNNWNYWYNNGYFGTPTRSIAGMRDLGGNYAFKCYVYIIG